MWPSPRKYITHSTTGDVAGVIGVFMKLMTALFVFIGFNAFAQANDCLPIGFTNEAKLQAVLRSDLLQNIEPLSEVPNAEARRASVELSTVRLTREGAETVIFLDYKVSLQNPSEELEIPYAFSVVQTCDGKLKVSMKRWGIPVH